MKKVIRNFNHFLIRLLIVVIPLTAIYFFAKLAFEENRRKEHPTDVGLGIAIISFNVFIILFIGFLVEFIKRIKKKQYDIALIDVLFLLLFFVPILYIHCQMGGCCNFFCDGFINLVSKM